MRLLANGLVLTLGLVATAVAADKPQVSMLLLTKSGLPLTASQQWYQALTELGVSGLQIRSAGPRDEMGIKQPGGAGKSFQVTGILAADNTLYLPGGKFSLNDKARLRKWLDSLGDEGAEGVTQSRSAFGLLPRQLEEVHSDLGRGVTFSTAGMPADKAVDQISRGLKLPVQLDPAARGELANLKVADELRELSAGTALAAILRPAGLVLLPERPSGGELHYRITASVAGREAWPVGWPTKDKPSKLMPELFQYLNVEIKEIPVSEALEAIQPRLKIPFVYDRSAMALHRADPASVMADVPEKRMTYSQILGKLLMQAKLKYELRVDEAEKPFLWITTVKPVR